MVAVGEAMMLQLIGSNNEWASCAKRDEAAPDIAVLAVAVRERDTVQSTTTTTIAKREGGLAGHGGKRAKLATSTCVSWPTSAPKY